MERIAIRHLEYYGIYAGKDVNMAAFPVDRLVALREEGKSFSEIATILNVSPNTLKSYARRHNEALSIITVRRCANCGTVLHSARKRLCTDKCRYAWNYKHRELHEHNAIIKDCPVCGKQFFTYASSNKAFCSRECYLVGRYGWK